MPELTATEIIRLLEEPTEHRYPIKLRITMEASGSALIQALQQASDLLSKQILADIVGDRAEFGAVSTLIELLDYDSEGLRCSAADALGKIRDPESGPALLAHLQQEVTLSPVKHLLASALGAVGYRQAIPTLIQALADPDPVLRGCAAWSLGFLKAIEAKPNLQLALSFETEPPDSFTRTRLMVALRELEE
jgi:HEAT repeat protein